MTTIEGRTDLVYGCLTLPRKDDVRDDSDD